MEIISRDSNVVKGDCLVTPTKIHNAVNSKADRIEMGISLTKDKELVCYSDDKILKKPVISYNYTELRRILPDIMKIEEAINEIDGKKPILLNVRTYDDEFRKIAFLLKQKALETYRDNPQDLAIMSSDMCLLSMILNSDYLNSVYFKSDIFINPRTICNQNIFDYLGGVVIPGKQFSLPLYKMYKERMSNDQELLAYLRCIDLKSEENDFERFENAGCNGIICDDVYKLERRYK